ncbi:unnamed protein product [Arctogadus glacialis]
MSVVKGDLSKYLTLSKMHNLMSQFMLLTFKCPEMLVSSETQPHSGVLLVSLLEEGFPNCPDMMLGWQVKYKEDMYRIERSVRKLVCPMWCSWLDHRRTQVISQASTSPVPDYSIWR